MTDNAELLKRRLKSLEDSREQLDDSLKQQIAYNRTLEREMQKLKPEYMQYTKSKDKYAAYVFYLKKNFLTIQQKNYLLLNGFFFKFNFLRIIIKFFLQVVKEKWNAFK